MLLNLCAKHNCTEWLGPRTQRTKRTFQCREISISFSWWQRKFVLAKATFNKNNNNNNKIKGKQLSATQCWKQSFLWLVLIWYGRLDLDFVKLNSFRNTGWIYFYILLILLMISVSLIIFSCSKECLFFPVFRLSSREQKVIFHLTKVWGWWWMGRLSYDEWSKSLSSLQSWIKASDK